MIRLLRDPGRCVLIIRMRRRSLYVALDWSAVSGVRTVGVRVAVLGPYRPSAEGHD